MRFRRSQCLCSWMKGECVWLHACAVSFGDNAVTCSACKRYYSGWLAGLCDTCEVLGCGIGEIKFDLRSLCWFCDLEHVHKLRWQLFFDVQEASVSKVEQVDGWLDTCCME